MKTRILALLALSVSLALLLAGGAPSTAAQGSGPGKAPYPPEDPRSPWQPLPGGDPAGPGPGTEGAGASPQATGGPDDFGYTWDDSVPLNWIDARAGTDTGIVGDDETGLVQIGFPFKYYDQVWTEVYASTNGILVFGEDDAGCCGEYPIPWPGSPNNVIAPFWDDLTVGRDYNPGAIYTLAGGSAPDRYLAVEWHRVTECCSRGATEYKTFQTILHENGDISLQYQTMVGELHWASVGIEDSEGTDGLQYPHTVTGNSAIRFRRPDPRARVRVRPLHQGRFTRAAETVAFQVSIHNSGELGTDTYDLTVSSTWPATLYAADGHTPLADTDSDGTVDTGPIAPGVGRTITVKVQTPVVVNVGDDNTTALTVRSSLDPARSQTARLQTAVPAPFAQVYRDGAGGAMSLDLAQPVAQAAVEATQAPYDGYDMSVAETAGGFAYVWYRGRLAGGVYVREIEYTLLDQQGGTLRPVSKLTDHTGAVLHTYDYEPVVAVAPNGRIGVAWYRYLQNPDNGRWNYNIYYAILDAAGNVVVPPANVTGNSVWGQGQAPLNVPRIEAPRIAATTDNRFVLAWDQHVNTQSGAVIDIYDAVYGTEGSVVKAAARFTNDTPGHDERHDRAALAELPGGRVLLAWDCHVQPNIYYDICYAVLDSAGAVVKPVSNASDTNHLSHQADAVALSDGTTVLAWRERENGVDRITYALLDGSYERAAGPITLDNPAALTGDDFVSAARDSAGHAILSWTDAILIWTDADPSYGRNLYYALVAGDGELLTGPMISRTSTAPEPRLWTNHAGFGNTSYSLVAPTSSEVDARVTAPTLGGGVPGGTAGVSTFVSNQGLSAATSVQLTAELDPELGYAGAWPAPTSVDGSEIRWDLPDVGFLGGGPITLYITVPMVPVGTRYAVDWTVTSAGPEANPADNEATTEVMASVQILLPVVLKGD